MGVLGEIVSPLIGLLVGLACGTVVTWLVLRTRINAAKGEARGENQSEIVRLTERVSSLTQELSREQARTNEFKLNAENYLNKTTALLAENAQLVERASRISSLDIQIGTLQLSLQEEISRTATLTEQCIRLAELEQKLEIASLERQQLNQQVADLREKLGGAESTAEGQRKRIGQFEVEVSTLIARRDQLIQEQEELKSKLAELTTTLHAERTQALEKLALLEGAKDQLSATFKSLANEILEEKATRFTEHNKTNIGQILEPLKAKIQEFQAKIDQVYVQDGRDRTVLGEQLKQLISLNQQLSQDANNLANALKGSSKTQGNWGELILERVLEASGLRKGHEYVLRGNYKHEDGHRGQPDVVINLPEDRHLIIDAKISLKDYEQCVNAESDSERHAALDRHIASVRRHIKELSETNYLDLCGLKSLDFVIMFVPIEPAFAMAVSKDVSLWEEALKKSVLLVSPSTLLFVLRTVAYLWRQEDQARNVREIADRGAELYNRLVGFVEDMDKLDDRLRQARESFDTAYKKLSTGQGNVIRQAEMLKDMGVKPTKLLPPAIRELALEENPVHETVAAVDESESA